MKNKIKLKDYSRILFLFIGLFLISNIFAQEQTIRGKVKDDLGEPIIGASVAIKGTINGTVTNEEGDFILNNVAPNSIIVFSYITYITQEVTFRGQQEINITLFEDNKLLEEVVVIGYGSLSKKELSSSIVQVNKDQFQQGAMNNPMEMLTGKVAGLNINNTALANPNKESSLQVRGAYFAECLQFAAYSYRWYCGWRYPYPCGPRHRIYDSTQRCSISSYLWYTRSQWCNLSNNSQRVRRGR